MSDIYGLMKCFDCKHEWTASGPGEKCPKCGSDNVMKEGLTSFSFGDMKCRSCGYRYEVNPMRSDGKPCPNCGSNNVISRGYAEWWSLPF